MDIKGFGKAAETLAEVIKDATGIIIDPIKKIVNSEAELIIEKRRAKKQLEIESLNIVNRTKLRLLETEIRRQVNLEEISQNAIEYLSDGSSPENLNIDWVNYFFDSCKDANEEYLKRLWGKILSEESDKSSSFSKITLDRIKVMTSEDCEKFEELSRLILFTKNNAIIIKMNEKLNFNTAYNYNFIDFLKMIDLGLVSKSEIARIVIPADSYLEVQKIDGSHQYLSNTSSNALELKFYLLTTSGRELLRLFSQKPNEGYFQNLKKSLIKEEIMMDDVIFRNNIYLHDRVD